MQSRQIGIVRGQLRRHILGDRGAQGFVRSSSLDVLGDRRKRAGTRRGRAEHHRHRSPAALNVSGEFTLNAPRDIVFFGKRHSRRNEGRARNE